MGRLSLSRENSINGDWFTLFFTIMIMEDALFRELLQSDLEWLYSEETRRFFGLTDQIKSTSEPWIIIFRTTALHYIHV